MQWQMRLKKNWIQQKKDHDGLEQPAQWHTLYIYIYIVPQAKPKQA